MDGLSGTKGGSGVWQRIISEMPEHDVYIEPFWGRGTIARRKRPARFTVGIDRDPGAFFHGGAYALMFLGCGMDWLEGYFRLSTGCNDDFSVARAPVNSSTGDGGGNGELFGCTFGGVPWARHCVYLDPPYLGRNRYAHKLDETDHRRLCRLFLRLPCPALLSGYWSELYESELGFCRHLIIPTVNRAGQRVEEYVWLNFDPPARYHDVRYVGSGRRPRERIRRRVRNWSAGLSRMSAAERQAVWEGCAAVYHATGEKK